MKTLLFFVLGFAFIANAQYDSRYWILNDINNNLDGVNRNLNNINNTLEGIKEEQHYRTVLQDQREHRKFFYSRLYHAHPDADQIISSEGFKEFMGYFRTKYAKEMLQPFIYKKKNIYKNSPDELIERISSYKQRLAERRQARKMLFDAHPDAKQVFLSEEYGCWLKNEGIAFRKQKTDLHLRKREPQILDYAQIDIQALSAYKKYKAEQQRKRAFYQTLYNTHPDVQKIVKTKQFHDWFAKEYNGQPLETVFRPFSSEGNPQMVENAILCLNKYKDFQDKESMYKNLKNDK